MSKAMIFIASAIVALIVGVGIAQATPQERVELRHSNNVLTFFSNHSWLVAPNQEKCWDVPWEKSCRIGRALVRKHTSIVTIPNTLNWTRAMRYAQRPFPGTYPRLDFLSNRECRACFTVVGGFVCNYEGSGACGPLQFMSGTFYGHMPEAKAYVEALGFRVPREVWDWRNPLGQALVGAYMHYVDIDGCHWCL